MAEIERLIQQAEEWWEHHKSRGAHIEAAACHIRIFALQDALRAVKAEETRT